MMKLKFYVVFQNIIYIIVTALAGLGITYLLEGPNFMSIFLCIVLGALIGLFLPLKPQTEIESWNRYLYGEKE